jgi:hypothetical protein
MYSNLLSLFCFESDCGRRSVNLEEWADKQRKSIQKALSYPEMLETRVGFFRFSFSWPQNILTK